MLGFSALIADMAVVGGEVGSGRKGRVVGRELW